MKGCSVCGYKEHHVALHFNHIDPSNKVRNVSACHSVKAVKEEIRKCEVLCANCHAIKTVEEKHFLNPPQKPTRAEVEKQKLVIRLAASRRRAKKLNGRCEGRKPYNNRTVIEQIVKLRKLKVPYQSIADVLNDQETPSPSGSNWYATAVLRIWRREKVNKGRKV